MGSERDQYQNFSGFARRKLTVMLRPYQLSKSRYVTDYAMELSRFWNIFHKHMNHSEAGPN